MVSPYSERLPLSVASQSSQTQQIYPAANNTITNVGLSVHIISLDFWPLELLNNLITHSLAYPGMFGTYDGNIGLW